MAVFVTLIGASVLGYGADNADLPSFHFDKEGETIVALKDGEILESFTYNPDEEVEIIVQFTTPPIAHTRASYENNGMSRYELNGIVNREINLIQAEHERFRNDLMAIQSGLETEEGRRLFKSVESEIRSEYSTVFNGVAVKTRRWVVDEISKLDYVNAVFPDTPVEAYANNATIAVKADIARNVYGLSGEGIVVGILDTGIDYTHPDLGGGVGDKYKVLGGKNFTTDNEIDFIDRHFHGTHVAGIVAADGDNLKGIAPKARLRAYKVLNDDGFGQQSWIISGIEQAVEDGVDIMNLSLGGGGHPDDPQSQAIDAATEAGVLCVIAAGNSANYMTIGSPGTARSALTVGATSLNDNITDFSSRGPTARTYEMKPDIVAPGLGILSTDLHHSYRTASGTSMASPVVAGVAALYLEKFPGTDPYNLKAILMNNADGIGEDVWTQGTGRINSVNALQADISITASSAFFGIIDVNEGEWSVTDTLLVRNHTESEQTVSFNLANSLPPGASLQFNQNNFTLSAGAQEQVVVTLSTNQNLDLKPVPPGYFGSIIAESDTNTIHSTFAFIKSPTIEVIFDRIPVILFVYDDSDFVRNYSSQFLSDEAKLLLPQNTYDLLTVFRSAENDQTLNYVVLNENIELVDYRSLNIRSSFADNELIYELRGLNNEPLPVTRQYTHFKPKNGEIGISMLGHYVKSVSDVSDGYTISTRLHSYKQPEGEIYEFPFTMSSGISSNQTLANDPSDFRTYNAIYDGHLGRTDQYINYVYYNATSPTYYTFESFVNSPFQRTFYLLPAPSDEYHKWFDRREHLLISENGTLVYQTPQISLSPDGEFKFFENSFAPEPIFTTSDRTITNRIGQTTPAWTGYTNNTSTSVVISRRTRGVDRQVNAVGFFTDHFGGAVQNPVSFELSDVDGDFNVEGTLDRLISFWQIPVNPGEYELVLEQNDYKVYNRDNAVAKARLMFDLTNGDRNPPYIHRMHLFSDNKASTIFNRSHHNKIEVVIDDDDEVNEVLFSIQKSGEEEWTLLSHQKNDDLYIIELSDTLEAGYYYSFRLYAKDVSGNTLEYTADPAFYLQGDSETLTPGFVSLLYPGDKSTDVPIDETFRWRQVQYAESYSFQLAEDADFTAMHFDSTGITGTGVTSLLLEPHFTYYWRVRAQNNIGEESDWSHVRTFTTGSTTDVDKLIEKPESYFLSQNYPNPFNPSTTIQYGLPEQSTVRLTIYNTLGQQVTTLVDSFQETGTHEVVWHANVTSGVYFYRIEAIPNSGRADRFVQVKRLVVLR